LGREVVEHDMHGDVWLDVGVDLTQEADEVLRTMLRLAGGNHVASRDIVGGKQIERAIA
jgi:hypothetical protein